LQGMVPSLVRHCSPSLYDMTIAGCGLCSCTFLRVGCSSLGLYCKQIVKQKCVQAPLDTQYILLHAKQGPCKTSSSHCMCPTNRPEVCASSLSLAIVRKAPAAHFACKVSQIAYIREQCLYLPSIKYLTSYCWKDLSWTPMAQSIKPYKSLRCSTAHTAKPAKKLVLHDTQLCAGKRL